jgi:hypothetical protein
VLDTIPRLEDFPYVKRAIQAFFIPLTRFSICLYLTFIIRINEVAEVRCGLVSDFADLAALVATRPHLTLT